MNIESQVVSLDLSKQLKEAKYKQKGLWWWVNYWRGTSYMWDLFLKDEDDKVNKHIVAPTVAELGERLPIGFKSYKTIKNKWICATILAFMKADTEANARAKMWLYLKKEGLL